jgi:hypothetical protein
MSNDVPEIKWSPDDDLLILDWSSIDKFQNCHKLAWYKFVNGYTPVEESLALTLGSCFHHALEVWDETGGDDGAALVAFANLAKSAGMPEKPSAEMRTADKKRTIVNGLDILQGYFNKWRSELKEETTIAREVGFALPLPSNPKTIVCGKMDKKFTRSGTRRIRDYKSASSIANNIATFARPNNQAQIYMWADSVISDERPELFDFDFLLVAVEKRNYERVLITWNKWDIEQMLFDLECLDKDIRYCLKNNAWPRSTGRCRDFGGCPFLGVCNVSNPEALLEAEFRVEYWRPYD